MSNDGLPHYEVGQRVRSTVQFEDPTSTIAPVGPNGFTLTDPTTIKGWHTKPAGDQAVRTYTNPGGDPSSHIVRLSQGVYAYDVDLDADQGKWAIRWFCPPGSTIVTATEDSFWVDGSEFVTPIP